MNPFVGKTALVTGASAGLGEEFALQLGDLGVTRLLITARRADRLDNIKNCLLAAYPAIQVDTLTADLSDDTALTKFIASLDKTNFAPDILINNAGFGDLGTFETSDPAKIQAMLALNILALTRLTRWAVPGMLAKKEGWI